MLNTQFVVASGVAIGPPGLTMGPIGSTMGPIGSIIGPIGSITGGKIGYGSHGHIGRIGLMGPIGRGSKMGSPIGTIGLTSTI